MIALRVAIGIVVIGVFVDVVTTFVKAIKGNKERGGEK
jgi:hypothetical protein